MSLKIGPKKTTIYVFIYIGFPNIFFHLKCAAIIKRLRNDELKKLSTKRQ